MFPAAAGASKAFWCVSGGGGGNHFGGLESATPRMLGGGEWRHGGVWGESAFRPSGGDF